jgi:putative ABC transport system ATP-binding protein
MDIFQRLNRERGITVLLITHEVDIAEYGTRIVSFRDGLVVADKPVGRRRIAQEELASLPAPVEEAVYWSVSTEATPCQS